jgi:hypothetical protein
VGSRCYASDSPMPTFSDTIQDLAAKFAEGVVQALRGVSLEDLRSGTAGRPPSSAPPAKRSAGRPRRARASEVPPEEKRRSADDLAFARGMIVKYVRSHPGAKAEAIRVALGIPRNKWARPLAVALAEKTLTKKGERGTATYWAG